MKKAKTPVHYMKGKHNTHDRTYRYNTFRACIKLARWTFFVYQTISEMGEREEKLIQTGKLNTQRFSAYGLYVICLNYRFVQLIDGKVYIIRHWAESDPETRDIYGISNVTSPKQI